MPSTEHKSHSPILDQITVETIADRERAIEMIDAGRGVEWLQTWCRELDALEEPRPCAMLKIIETWELWNETAEPNYKKLAANQIVTLGLTVKEVKLLLTIPESDAQELVASGVSIKQYVHAEQIRELRDAGWSIRKISKQLGVGVGTVHRALNK
jgi:hypothetical protein